MLWIGDIHINRKNASEIVTHLRGYVDAHPGEQHIIFLGDYVYHFQYERSALLALYQFFLDLYSQGKSLYILAGNHDWIQNYFVYEEARRSFALQAGDTQLGSIHFITHPEIFHIEGQDCLFFPYTPFLELEEEMTSFAALCHSSHLGEQLSGKANAFLSSLIKNWRKSEVRTDELWIFHHRYLADTQFPGQKARFSFKNHALSSEFALQDDLLLISGHIHQPFVREHYICVGSIWSTSPLETNQVKYLFQVNPTQKKLIATSLFINPYIHIKESEIPTLNKEILDDWRKQIYTSCCQYLSTSHLGWTGDIISTDMPRKNTLLTLESEKLSYESLGDYLDDDLFQLFKRVVIKRPRKITDILGNDLHIASKELDTSIAHWKQLLEEYIQTKYQDESGAYLEMLSSLGIL